MSACLPALLAGLCLGYLLCFCTVIASGIVGEWRRRRQWRPPINVDGDHDLEKFVSVVRERLSQDPAELHEQARDRIRRGR